MTAESTNTATSRQTCASPSRPVSRERPVSRDTTSSPTQMSSGKRQAPSPIPSPPLKRIRSADMMATSVMSPVMRLPAHHHEHAAAAERIYHAKPVLSSPSTEDESRIMRGEHLTRAEPVRSPSASSETHDDDLDSHYLDVTGDDAKGM